MKPLYQIYLVKDERGNDFRELWLYIRYDDLNEVYKLIEPWNNNEMDKSDKRKWAIEEVND